MAVGGFPLGRTHWDVHYDVAEIARGVVWRFGGTWNTYEGHGSLSGHSERRTVDFWGDAGRGDPLPETVGDAMVGWLLGQHQVDQLAMLIWWSYWWRPLIGWEDYPGWAGPHGPGPDAHIHIVVE